MVWRYGMATMSIRTTFALDVATEGSIQRLAKLWGTSKAEVVRRSVAEAEQSAALQALPSPLKALDWLQANGTVTEAKADAWSRSNRKGWEEAFKKREPLAPSKPKASRTK